MFATAIITARLDSSRIPNKIFLPLVGKPVLEHVVDRLRLCRRVNEIILAIPEGQKPLKNWAARMVLKVVEGSEDDVLDRISESAKLSRNNACIRITADLPFLAPEGIDHLVSEFSEQEDYSNSIDGIQPYLDGTNAEIAWREAIFKANAIAPRDKLWRQHAFILFRQSDSFRTKAINAPFSTKDIEHLELMVDEPFHMKIAERLMQELSGDTTYSSLCCCIRENKEWIERVWCEG